nr:reverse transcriptase domain-containing protein [Tanacetum cinerariifolium]
MTDNRTMAELLRAPTEGYAEAIVVPTFLAEQFDLKHSLINIMTIDQFFRLEKDNPRDHIRWFNKITSTIKYRDVPNSVIKLILFPFSLVRAARRTTNLRNEILNFQQRFDESFHEALDRYKDLLLACPHHCFTKLHQLDTFYNALNPADQDSLNADAGGNLFERKIAKLTHAVNQQTSVVTTAMIAMLKQFQATPPPALVKDVEEICVTYGGAVNYNQGNPGYRPYGIANQIRQPGFAQPNVQNNQNRFGQHQGFNRGNNFNHEQSYQATTQQNQNFHLNELEKIKRINEANMKAMQTQIDTVKNELRNEMKSSIQTSLSNQTNEIKNMMASLLQINTAFTSGGYPKKLPEKLRDPGKFLSPYGFSELKCKALTDLGASINLMQLSVWKKLGLPELIPTRMTLELANRTICTPTRIARDIFVLVGKFTFLADFVIVDYESDPRVPLILGRPFLRTACTLIDVYGEEMILYDGDERLTLNMKHDTSSYSNQPQKESKNLINVFNNSSEDFLEDLFPEGCSVLSGKFLDLDSTKDLHPPHHDNPLSGSTTYFSNSLLEEFTDELALITCPLEYNDNLQFDIESNLKEIEFLLYQDKDSSLKDSIDQKNFESDAGNVYDDPLDSKEEKIKESKLLIDELDLPCDFLPLSEYDSFISQDFLGLMLCPQPTTRTRYLTQVFAFKKKPVKIITRVVQDKKLEISNASLVLEDFDPPFYEPFLFKDVPKSKMLLLFSSKNEEKVFKPRIHTFEKVHSYFIPELSHQGYKVFKINQVFKSLMKIFLFYCGKDTHILAVLYHHLYPP